MIFSNEMGIAVITFRKGLAELMVTIILMKKFICDRKVTDIIFFNFSTRSCKTYQLRNINSIGCSSWHISVQDGNIYNVKIEIVSLINFTDNSTNSIPVSYLFLIWLSFFISSTYKGNTTHAPWHRLKQYSALLKGHRSA